MAIPWVTLAANNVCEMKLSVGPVAFKFQEWWISVLWGAVKNDPGAEGESEGQGWVCYSNTLIPFGSYVERS